MSAHAPSTPAAVSTLRSVCVYCGSRAGDAPDYLEAASAMGAALAAAGLKLVYGGARVGLMGAVADAALAGGAEVLGVMHKALVRNEVAHDGLTELCVVETMHARKLAMAEAADAFVALPGGFGTLEEFFEMLTWHQLGLHAKPCGLLDTAGFYAPLRDCLHHMQAAGFVSAAHVDRIHVAREPAALLSALAQVRAPA